ncbi:cell surface receptor IPT TIG domain-containing protein [Fusarium denticulatum]|uniref:Cell surface receptor IPT TIG domain-containing protein n=1 Tax=Fusarium denticulatum TaxID=48507 RepID=A0A8H5TE13_9HYPO|nr:cell surface receptor IPT TIG domain-containing protein [Fusarium denticulatum]
MPPQISQPSRLNSLFVIPGPGSHKKIAKRDGNRRILESLEPKEPAEPLWQAANEWDQPIWGWVVINYANSGLQFFLPDGTFYREVRLPAGPDDKMSFDPSHEPLWLPSQQPDDPKEVLRWDMQQLSRLVETLANSTPYLGKFIDMVQRASSAKTSAPVAILKLAGPEWTSQMDDDPAPSRTLLPPHTEDEDVPQQYHFPIEIGDEQPGFDGLVGYFLPKAAEDVEQGDRSHQDILAFRYSKAPGCNNYDE